MDFYDKLITSIVLIVVTFLCVFNTFCFAYTVEDLDGFGLSYIGPATSGTYNNSPNNKGVLVYDLEVGKRYTLKNTSDVTGFIRVSEEYPAVGVKAYFGSVYGLPSQLSPGSEFSFLYNGDYIYLYTYSNVSDLTIELIPDTGISSAVDSLVQNVGISNIWDTFELSLPYVLIVVVVGFGFYMILSLVRKLQKGKARL